MIAFSGITRSKPYLFVPATVWEIEGNSVGNHACLVFVPPGGEGFVGSPLADADITTSLCSTQTGILIPQVVLEELLGPVIC